VGEFSIKKYLGVVMSFGGYRSKSPSPLHFLYYFIPYTRCKRRKT